MRLKTLLIAIMLCFLISGSFSTIFLNERCEARGNEFYVDDNHYPYRDGTAEHPWATINYALNKAGEGDTIYVFGGVYNESLKIDKNITIIGSVDDGNSILFDSEKHKYTVEITADFVTLEGFNITDTRNKNRVAMVFIRSNSVVIQGNNITQSSTWGIYLDSPSKDNTIGNNFINKTRGIYLYSSSNNVLSGNNVSNSADAGVNLFFSNNNIIYNNSFFSNKYGVYLSDCSNCNISDNSIGNNIIDGIKITGGSDNIARRNIVKNNDGNGIDLNSLGTIVRDNTFNRNQIGINLIQSNCNIINNTLFDNLICGLYASSATKDNTIYLNKFKYNSKNAQEKGSNTWYKGFQGNKWDDYNKVDRNLDDIGDTPYAIPGGGVDLYPLGYFLKRPNRPENPDPEDNESGVGLRITLKVEVSDVDSDFLDVYFYNAVDETLCGVDYDVRSEDVASCSFNLPFDKTYAWYAIANDSLLENRSDIWFFTTRQRPPENKKPVADPGGPYLGMINQLIEFNASDSYDPDGNIDFYRWNFGDGTSEILDISPEHSYSNPEVYKVTLTVIDNNGTSAMKTTNVEITSTPINKDPVAIIDGPFLGKVDKKITFNGSSSYDSDGSISNYTWDFHDGSKGYGVNPTRKYKKTGEFNVTLTVTDNKGAQNSVTTTIFINPADDTTPGFEIIFFLIAIALILTWKKRKNRKDSS